MCTRSTLSIGTGPDGGVSVVVPVYNNAGSLTELHSRLTAVLGNSSAPFEIVYVNDASVDDSFDVLERLQASDERVTVVDLEQNVGQSAAVLTALRLVRGDIVVTIDADLENHPEDIPALVNAIRRGAELACGARQRRRPPLLTRGLPSMIANGLVGRALGVPLDDWGCGLNAVSAELLRRLLVQDPPPALPKIEAALLSTRIAQIAVRYSVRDGESAYTARRLGAFAATFLRHFESGRMLRRLRGGTRATLETPGSESPRFGPMYALTAFASWGALSAAALVARALAAPRSAATPPAHIRAISNSRRVGAGDQGTPPRVGIVHSTSSLDVDSTTNAFNEPD